jgi:biotin carboxyl carrier protein
MRLSLAIASALLLAIPATASAAAGGASFPERSGGMSYGAPSTSRPMISLFSVQRRVREDRMPKVRFRIDELGVERLRVRIAVVPLSRSGRALSVNLGRRPTSRTTTVRWPSSARLKPGRYRVRLHAVDPWGRKLLRLARASGLAPLTVTRAPRPKPKPAPVPPAGDTAPPPPVAPPVAPGTDGVFPVAGPHTYGDGIGAARKGHTHEGVDLNAAEGTPVVAPVAGTILKTDYQSGGAGHYVVQNAADGRAFFFAHCQSGSIAVSGGQAVAAGQMLCRVGQTGSATGPHLHFEIWVGGWRVPGGSFVDPLPQLRSWDR